MKFYPQFPLAAIVPPTILLTDDVPLPQSVPRFNVWAYVLTEIN